MRLLVESINGTRIFKDRSPDGLPRWVVDDDNSIRVFNKIYYSLDKVRECINQEHQKMK